MVARPAQIHATSVGQRESSDTSNNVSASPSEPIGTVSPIPPQYWYLPKHRRT